MPPYLLLDGHSLAFRAWFALQDANLVTSSGQETQAVYGFAGMLARLLADHSPAGMAVAFDRGEPTFRDEIAADYKAGRASTPQSLHDQVGLIRRMVELIGVPAVDLAGYEADDVIATLVSRLDEAGEDVIVVTGDRDAYQLVHDPHVKVLYNRRGVTDYVLYDEAGISERTGVAPARYPMLAALRGDPSDNLPGVPGVGEKTAARLVNSYGDLDELYGHLDDLTPKLREALAAHELRVRQNFRLTPVVRDAPVECELEDMAWGRSSREELLNFFATLEITGPRDRILQSLDRFEKGGGDGSGTTQTPAAAPNVPINVVAPTDPEAVRDELSQIVAAGGKVAVEPAWVGTPGRSPLAGVACALARRGPKPENAARDVLFVDGSLLDSVAGPLSALLGRAPEGERRLVVLRAKELMRALMPAGYSFDGLDLDVSVASFLADPSSLSSTSPTGAVDSGRPTTATQLGLDIGEAGGGAGGMAAQGVAEETAARALALETRAGHVRQALRDSGSEHLYDEIERPLVRVLAKMEIAGIGVDSPRLEAINGELTSQAAALEETVQGLAGEPFKVSSTPQLRHILFDVLGLAPQKRTKTGYSTDAQSLERLRGAHPIVEALLSYREVEKLRSTYGAGLLDEVAADGRIHATFHQTVARTGRLSSDRPNLHNIPVRSELGRPFRDVFVPAEGREMLVADYDQIELRVIAHLAEDPGLVQAFASGLDIHSETAQRIFGVDAAGVTAQMRSRAKMVSYGLAYGMEAYGLSQRLAIPVEEAAEILGQYFTAFPNVKAYMTRTVADARAHGYTETLFGRRRYLPDLGSSNYQVRQAAERQAMNAGIQGLAADIFKVALVHLDSALESRGFSSRIVLQVHDEIIVETPREEAEAVAALTEEVMTGAAALSVPLAVHVASGPSWGAAKQASSFALDAEPEALDLV